MYEFGGFGFHDWNIESYIVAKFLQFLFSRNYGKRHISCYHRNAIKLIKSWNWINERWAVLNRFPWTFPEDKEICFVEKYGEVYVAAFIPYFDCTKWKEFCLWSGETLYYSKSPEVVHVTQVVVCWFLNYLALLESVGIFLFHSGHSIELKLFFKSFETCFWHQTPLRQKRSAQLPQMAKFLAEFEKFPKKNSLHWTFMAMDSWTWSKISHHSNFESSTTQLRTCCRNSNPTVVTTNSFQQLISFLFLSLLKSQIQIWKILANSKCLQS